jgi:hypothetical protein
MAGLPSILGQGVGRPHPVCGLQSGPRGQVSPVHYTARKPLPSPTPPYSPATPPPAFLVYRADGRALQECFYAYRWAISNLEQLGSRGDRVCIAGDSAGGNLAVAVALRCGVEVPILSHSN